MNNGQYFSHKMTYVGVVKRVRLHAVANVGHDWQDITTAYQKHKVVDKLLLQFHLERGRGKKDN